jgi:hypothetical protein
MYAILRSVETNEPYAVIRLSDNAGIPMSDDNSDYQEYLKWLEEENEPVEWEDYLANH